MDVPFFAGVLPELRPGSHQHSHSCWEMVRYVEGHGVLTVGGQPIPFAPGTIMALPPNVAHGEEATGGYRCYFIGLTGPRTRSHIPVCQDDEHGSFLCLCELLVRESLRKQPGWEAASGNLTSLLWRFIERWTGPQDRLVQQAEATLLANLADPELRISTIAKQLDVNEENLRRRFSAGTGKSPRAYLTDLRIEAAKQLLAQGASVGEAATGCGFVDPFHFSNIFMKETGRRPSELLEGPERFSACTV